MKTNEINIRDPFILFYLGNYYMYGTRSETAWGKAEGFDCYESKDLIDWSGPIEIFKRPETFFADRNFWAPECYAYKGKFYLITTLGAEDRKKAIYILVSDYPTGPFVMHTQNQLSPEGWASIDGTLFITDDNIPYLIFSHTFEDVPEGEICALQLSEDLKTSVGNPVFLFSAKSAPWAKPVPFAKEEFGLDGDIYFADGPFVCSVQNRLMIIWSSWSYSGYSLGAVYSKTGLIEGPWYHLEEPLFTENGGHGMALKKTEDEWLYVLHAPNDHLEERPMFYNLVMKEGELRLECIYA